jgi:glycerate dehydrogenase
MLPGVARDREYLEKISRTRLLMVAAPALKIVFLDRETLGPRAVLRTPSFPHELECFPRTSVDQIAARIVDADIVITNKVPLDRATIHGPKRLRLVAVAATGANIIDTEACRERGVIVSNIRGYARHTVPEHVWALIFALRRNLIAYRHAVQVGRWQESDQFCFFDHPIDDLSGSTLGLIGAGDLGAQVGRIAGALGMNVQFAARKGQPLSRPDRVSFETLLRTSDVISLHCPLTAETRNLIDYPEFQAMARKPIVINTARGGLVNEHALVRALDEGLIAGAGFDVATAEPPPQDHPLMRVASRPNVIVTPHVAWASRGAVQALADQLVDNLEAFAAGSPRNRLV